MFASVQDAVRKSFTTRRSIDKSLSANPPRHRAIFPNGDRYDGGWKDGRPHGNGRYVWSDGSWYDGCWRDGEKCGEGQYYWADGTTYQGDWSQGRMNGTGVYTTPEGSRYEGSMLDDRRHGLGRMEYSNGDWYEGLWKEGRPHGPGQYRWATGNEYDGEWADGRMQGRGTFLWASGERYDGDWSEGRESGFGLFTWANGATFQGTWVGGKKNGVGIYTPAEGGLEPEELFPAAPEVSAGALSHENSVAAAGDRPLQQVVRRATIDRVRAESGLETSTSLPKPPPATSKGGDGAADWLIVREYERDALLKEERVPRRALRKIHGVNTRERKRAARTAGEVTRAGETIYRGHRSYDLMISLQQGIRWSVGRGGMGRDSIILEDAHFREKGRQFFPHAGSHKTPPHPASDFAWKDYAPEVFRKLRKAFGIDAGDFMLSICGDRALRELTSPGKSGSVFYITQDDQYILKTVQKNECKILMDVLPRYYQHMQRFPDSLLTRFYGLYRIDTGVGAGKRVRFVVMGNIFRTDLSVHTRYDLKGSTVGRATPPFKQGPGTTLKDLDLDVSFKMEKQWRDKLLFQLRMDTELLEHAGIMDYSLLIGVHYRARDTEKAKDQGRQALARGRDARLAFDDEPSEDEDPPPPGARRPLLGAAAAAASGRAPEQDGGASFSPIAEEEAGGSGRAAHASLREAQGTAEGNGTPAPAPAPTTAPTGGPVTPLPQAARSRPLSLYVRVHSMNEATMPALQTPGSVPLGPEAASLLQRLLEEGWYREKTRGQSRPAHPEQTTQRGALQTPMAQREGFTRTNTFRPEGATSTDFLNRELGYSKVQLGSNMAATAVRRKPWSPLGYKSGTAAPDRERERPSTAGDMPADDVVLYLGVIDILQHYRLFKRVEHTFKSLRFDSKGVSVTHPGAYAARFNAFMENVFI